MPSRISQKKGLVKEGSGPELSLPECCQLSGRKARIHCHFSKERSLPGETKQLYRRRLPRQKDVKARFRGRKTATPPQGSRTPFRARKTRGRFGHHLKKTRAVCSLPREPVALPRYMPVQRRHWLFPPMPFAGIDPCLYDG